MRNAQEWKENHDQLTHEHVASNYTWGDNPDGSIWQIGPCNHCDNDVKRNIYDGIATEWVLIPQLSIIAYRCETVDGNRYLIGPKRGQMMKLTKRGKRARALVILAGLLLAIKGINFMATHHTVNTTCQQTEIGLACDYKWVSN